MQPLALRHDISSPEGATYIRPGTSGTCHKMWIVSDDVMFVSMSDVIVGYLRPPDESGGYRMTDGIACFSQYPTIPNTQYPTPNRRTKLPLSRSLNLPLSTTASVALISFPNYQRTSRMLLPEKCVPFLIFCFLFGLFEINRINSAGRCMPVNPVIIRRLTQRTIMKCQNFTFP